MVAAITGIPGEFPINSVLDVVEPVLSGNASASMERLRPPTAAGADQGRDKTFEEKISEYVGFKIVDKINGTETAPELTTIVTDSLESYGKEKVNQAWQWTKDASMGVFNDVNSGTRAMVRDFSNKMVNVGKMADDAATAIKVNTLQRLRSQFQSGKANLVAMQTGRMKGPLLSDHQKSLLKPCFKTEAYFLAADVIIYVTNGIDRCGDTLIVSAQSKAQQEPVNITAKFSKLGEFPYNQNSTWVVRKIEWPDSIKDSELTKAWPAHNILNNTLSTDLLINAITAVKEQKSIIYARYIAEEQCLMYQRAGINNTRICDLSKDLIVWEGVQAAAYQEFINEVEVLLFEQAYHAQKDLHEEE